MFSEKLSNENPGLFLPCCQNSKKGLEFAKLCRKSKNTNGKNEIKKIPIEINVFLLTGNL